MEDSEPKVEAVPPPPDVAAPEQVAPPMQEEGKEPPHHVPISASTPALIDLMDAPLGLLPAVLAEDIAPGDGEKQQKQENHLAPETTPQAEAPEGQGILTPGSQPGSPREPPSDSEEDSEGVPEEERGSGGEDGEEESEDSDVSIDDETAALLGARAMAASPTKAPAPAREATRRETLLASAVGALGALTRGGGTGDPEKDKEIAARDNAERMKVRGACQLALTRGPLAFHLPFPFGS